MTCFLRDLVYTYPNWDKIQSTLINYSYFLIFRKKYCITRSQLNAQIETDQQCTKNSLNHRNNSHEALLPACYHWWIPNTS